MENLKAKETFLRTKIVKVGEYLWQRGLVAANDGNISARLSATEILITPTGISKGMMQAEELIVVDLEGKVLRGDLKPSSEQLMHLEVYQQRTEIEAVVHAHPPYATTFAVAGESLTKQILTEVTVLVGEVPLAPFALPSTAEVAESIHSLILDHDLILLEFHGALTLGRSLDEAYYNMERLEFYARISWNLRQGGIEREFNPKQAAKLAVLKLKLQGVK